MSLASEAPVGRGRRARALLGLGALAVVLALGVGWSSLRGAARTELARALHEARVAAARGNAVDLERALTLLDGRQDSGAAVSLAAALWTDLWLLHRQPGAEARARAALARAIALDARTDERFAVQVSLLLEQGEARGAAELAEARRREGFSGPRLLLAQGRAWQALGNLPQSRAAFAAAADGARHDGNFSAALGEALLEQGVPGAADAFRTALDLSPGLWRATLGLALVRARAKVRLPEAEAAVADALARGSELSPPLRARALAVQAGLLLARDDAEAGAATAQRALDLFPLEPWALFFRGVCLAARRDPAAAATLEQLWRRAPGAEALVLEGAAALGRAGQTPAALALLERLPVRTPTAATRDGGRPPEAGGDDLYWLTRGEVLASAVRPDEALAAYAEAIAARGPHLAQARYARAAALLARRDTAGAEGLLLELTPEDGSGAVPEAYLALGELRFQQHDYPGGSQSYALGLARLQQAQAPAARRTAVYLEVRRRLEAAGQMELGRLWREDALPLTR
jgi:tetratricopeptide (TPR) repeat protein